MVTVRNVLTAIALCSSAAGIAAQNPRPTIPEILARTEPGGGFVSATMPSGPAPAIDTLLSRVDVVVRGVVGDGQSYLSEDQREVFTDYQIINPIMLYQKSLGSTKVPGTVSAVSVTLRGGAIVVNGREFVARESGLPSLPKGAECLFLLAHENGKNMIAGRYYGAFAIRDGRVVPLTLKEGYARELEGASGAQVISGIVSRLTSMHR